MFRPAGVTRRELIMGTGAALAGGAVTGQSSGAPVRPTPEQAEWQEAELTMFLHFGVNTFTGREWGDGREDPRLFNPVDLDAGQWVRAAKEAGFKYLILTAKHHDGFCLWPSRFTRHSVAASPWRGGRGDVVREFTRACREARLRAGLYLSPWDRHEPSYGDSPAYNRHYVNQLTELLTDYGEIAEVWFDGANGEGPNGKRQVYDWPAFYAAIRRLQPKSLIAITGPDIRWVGNEDGFAHETEWSVRDPDPAIHGQREGKVWWPAECDVSIRPGWFWRASEDSRVKSVAQLTGIYFKSVGRNSNLLLNVPPDNRGLLAQPDVLRLREFRAELDRLFAANLARGAKATSSSEMKGHGAAAVLSGSARAWWSPSAEGPAILELELARPAEVRIASLQEQISQGQRISAYRVELLADSGWREVSRGTTIGHRKLDRFEPVRASRARLTIEKSMGKPCIRSVGLY